MNLFDRIVELTALDRPAGAASRIAGRLLANRRVKDALHGVWLGHPLHPALAQLTLSSFTAASLIDARAPADPLPAAAGPEGGQRLVAAVSFWPATRAPFPPGHPEPRQSAHVPIGSRVRKVASAQG